MATLNWQKSTFSSGDGNTNCLEVAAADDPHPLRLRESDAPTDVLAPTAGALCGLLLHLKAGHAPIR